MEDLKPRPGFEIMKRGKRKSSQRTLLRIIAECVFVVKEWAFLSHALLWFWLKDTEVSV